MSVFRHKSWLCTVFTVAAVGAAAPISAQDGDSVDGNGRRAGDARVPAVTAAYRGGPIDVDGRVIEEAWQSAVPAPEFIQGLPIEGARAEVPTDVRILYDERALYVGVVMTEDEPERMGDQLVRRDTDGQYDYFELSLDPNRDRRTGYKFRISAAGVQADAYLFNDVNEDVAWNAVWQSAVHRDSTGWSAELRIPLSQIRYEPHDSVQWWGLNLTRRRLATNEITYLSLESRTEYGKVSVFGQLQGLDLPRSARRLEVEPYVLTSAFAAPSIPGNPFFDGTAVRGQAGFDLRYGLGQYTLDLSVNPDFGQVEVDPAVINLTAFETFFPEKRPFFVEDGQLFAFPPRRVGGGGRGGQAVFHSRRIGREPHGSSPGGSDFEDIPRQTTIVGAAKFTGRTSGGLSIGALAALTDREYGRAFTTGDPDIQRFVVEPRSQHGVFRLQQDLRDGASRVGAIVTGTHRELPNDGSFDNLTTNAFSAGVDFEHNWGGPRSRDWALWGFMAGSYISGSETALLDVQEASNHYFQRPDATRFSVDSSRTSLSGINWRLQFERRSAVHWTGAVWLAQVTPGFEVNDLGFWTRGERIDGGARLSYQEIVPGKVFRSYRFSFWTFHNFRHEALDDFWSASSWARAHQRGAFSATAEFEFLNWWGFELQGRYSPTSMSDVATRGGPLMIDPASTTVEFRGSTDRRSILVVSPEVSYDDRHRGGYQLRTELEISLRPTPSFEFQLEPTFTSELDPAQYVDATDDVGYAPTFGSRYLFADIERRTFALEARINAAFTPNLSLQLFAQPLLSSGKYVTYKQLLQSETFDFDRFEEGSSAVLPNDDVACVGGRTCVSDGTRYVDFDGNGTTDFSFDNQDFNVRSFRMNAVLRWEYRPGSVLFLVWQQSRSQEITDGTFSFGRDFSSLWRAPAENMFIVKLSYWLGL